MFRNEKMKQLETRKLLFGDFSDQRIRKFATTSKKSFKSVIQPQPLHLAQLEGSRYSQETYILTSLLLGGEI